MKFEKLVPSVFYSKIKESNKLFIDCLDFKIVHEELDTDSPYRVIEKDGIGILVFENREYAKIIKPELRIVTKNIDSVYQKVISSFSDLLHPNLNVITLRPWGAEEFAIFDNQVCFIIQEWKLEQAISNNIFFLFRSPFLRKIQL